MTTAGGLISTNRNSKLILEYSIHGVTQLQQRILDLERIDFSIFHYSWCQNMMHNCTYIVIGLSNLVKMHINKTI